MICLNKKIWELNPAWPDANVPNRLRDVTLRRAVMGRCLSYRWHRIEAAWNYPSYVEDLQAELDEIYLLRAVKLRQRGARIYDKRASYVANCPSGFMIHDYRHKPCMVWQVCPNCFARTIWEPLHMIADCGYRGTPFTLIEYYLDTILPVRLIPANNGQEYHRFLRGFVAKQISERRDMVLRLKPLGAISIASLVPRKDGWHWEASWMFKVKTGDDLTRYRALPSSFSVPTCGYVVPDMTELRGYKHSAKALYLPSMPDTPMPRKFTNKILSSPSHKTACAAFSRVFAYKRAMMFGGNCLPPRRNSSMLA